MTLLPAWDPAVALVADLAAVSGEAVDDEDVCRHHRRSPDGAFQALLEISAVRNDQVFGAGIKYIWQLDLTAWGWIHLLIGAVLILVAIFLLRAARWASWAGIALAGLSAVANYLFIPRAPLWAIVIIALDVAIIWALSTRRETIRLLDD